MFLYKLGYIPRLKTHIKSIVILVKNTSALYWLALIFFVFVVYISTDSIKNVFSSLATGCIIWVLTTLFPEMKRKRIIKNNLRRYYDDFKRNTIRTLLSASGARATSTEIEQLCDFVKFRDFFASEKHEKWYAVLNGIQGNEEYLSDLILEFELLSNEITYVMNNICVSDESVYAFAKPIHENLYRLQNSRIYKYDQTKYLGSSLWELLANSSSWHGPSDIDLFEQMLAGI